MDAFISIIIAVLITIAIALLRNSAEDNENNKKNKDSNIGENTALKTSISALQSIGCQPTVDGNSISVSYQGEHFQIECSGYYARIWDPSWSHIKADDKDLPKIREAVNAANYNFGLTIVLSDPDNDGDILIHSKRDIMLHPSFTDAPEYMRSVLDSFFPIKDELRNNYQQIIEKQKESKLAKRRPIGFTASHQFDEEKGKDNN